MTVYKDISELVGHLQKSAQLPHVFPMKNEPDSYLWVDARNSLPEELEWVNCGRDFSPGKLIPSNFSGGLYRGQAEICSPCCPRIYRGFPLVGRPRNLSSKYRTKFLAAQIKTMWFISLLQEHPAIHHARRLKIQIDPVAVAQHYGMSTDYLDLTQSIEVAAFFACCSECKDKIWKPKSTGQGVIYRLSPAISLEKRRLMAKLIGLVTFPRPGEQQAWAIPVRMGFDFGKVPQVEAFLFNHTIEGSMHYLKMFDFGRALFVEDPAADLANSVINSNEIPENFLVDVLLRFGCFSDKLGETLKIFKKRLKYYCNIEVKKKVAISFTNEQIKKIRFYLTKRKDDFRGKAHPVRIGEHCRLPNEFEIASLLYINNEDGSNDSN